MDDIVKQAMAKWPSVPPCYGWLGLDSRGAWYIRDEITQARGAFPLHRGDPLKHPQWLAFIGRNYNKDEEGQWYFQNGPQRVYVELECTPWIYRLDPTGFVYTHTGHPIAASRCLLDEKGKVYLVTDLGLGLVHSADVGLVADQIEKGVWETEAVAGRNLQQLFGFKLSPQGRRAAK